MKTLQKFNIKSNVKELDTEGNKGIVTIYVSAFNKKDNVGDIVMPTAFNKTITERKKDILHLLNHNWDNFIGLPIDFKTDNIGLLVTSALNLDTDIARQTFSNYKFAQAMERTLKHSFGYEIIKENFDEQKNANILTEIKLYEYSTLTRPPANDNTPLVSLKSETEIKNIIQKLENLYNSETIDSRLKQIELALNNFLNNFQILTAHAQTVNQNSEQKNNSVTDENIAEKIFINLLNKF